MVQPTADIAITDNDTNGAATIEAALMRSLHEMLPQAENSSFVLSAKSSDGGLVGGLTASTSYGWLLVKTLWVAEINRHQGLGRSLMNAAETKALDIGCHSAWLDTSSPDAMQFYRQLGYQTFGRLSNTTSQHPETHQRWFMKKQLTAPVE